MKKLLLVCLLLVASFAQAGWVLVSEDDRGDIYIDPDTLQKNDAFRKIWQLQDLKVRDPYGEMSRRTWKEYECGTGRTRILMFVAHSSPMVEGKPISSGGASGRWSDIAPRTADEATFRKVCAN